MKKALLVLLLFLSFGINAQVTRQQADDLVLASVVGNRIEEVNVYSDPLIQTDAYYKLCQYDSIASAYSSYWLYFIDDYPNYYWGHECRYVFVNANNGAVTTINSYLPPYGYLSTLEPVSVSSIAPTFNGQCATHFQTIVPNASVNSNKYALLIAGPDYGNGFVKDEFWNAISHSYCSLLEHGYMKNNIYAFVGDGTASSNAHNCLDLDGQGDDDIRNECCNVFNISKTINSIKQTILPSDILYIGICCHGWQYATDGVSFALWNGEQLYDTYLASLLSGIDCSQIIVNIQACHAGGFVDDFTNLSTTAKKSIICCINKDLPYYPRPSFVTTTRLDEYCYFTISSLREAYPCIDSVWVQADSLGHYDDFFTIVGKYEKDFDSLDNGGNQDGIHELGETISLAKEYDNQFNTNGVWLYDCGFKEDLLTLVGIGGAVDSCQVVLGNFHIERNLAVNADSLSILTGTNLYLFDSDLSVSENSKLIFSDSTNIIAKTGNCRFVVNGTVCFGDGMTFRSESNRPLEIIFENDVPLNISNVTFENCILTLPQSSIGFTSCRFIGTPINPVRNSLTSDTCSIIISHCNFSPLHSDLDHAIRIDYYENYTIEDCEINGGDYTFSEGISIWNCGMNSRGTRNITGNRVSGCRDSGVLMYHSAGNITMNEIDHNRIGIKLLHNCNIGRISGRCLSTEAFATQYIHDNTEIEIYITDSSLPNRMRYNVISHTGNGYWIKHESNVSSEYSQNHDSYIDFKYNRWGNGITPTNELFTDSGRSFEVTPTWVMGQCYNEQTDVMDLLDEADSLLSEGKSSFSKMIYKQIIYCYPESIAANSAVKSLINAENLLDEGYEDLREYFLLDNTIMEEPTLCRLGSSLANNCDEILGNNYEAIAWYENIISDTATCYNDSLFATIDLMELSMRMAHNREGTTEKFGLLYPRTRSTLAMMEQHMISPLPRLESGLSVNDKSKQEYLPCKDLRADVQDGKVVVSWNLPDILSSEMRLSWSAIQDWELMGIGSYEEIIDFAHRFDTTELKPFVGWRIKDISIYFYNETAWWETTSARIWLGEMVGDHFETEAIYQSPGFYHQEDSWTTIILDTNIFIPEGEEVWIGYNVTKSGDADQWYAMDNTPSIHQKGDMIRHYYDWNQLPQDWSWMYFCDNNWMISATIEDPERGQHYATSHIPQLSGCRIYKNGNMIADFHQPERIYYVDENPGDGNVEYCVSMVYDDEYESEPVCVPVEILAANEYNDGSIRIFPNPASDNIEVDGCEVYEIQVFDHLGHHVESLIGTNCVNVTDYANGLYLLKIISEKGIIFKRVVVV